MTSRVFSFVFVAASVAAAAPLHAQQQMGGPRGYMRSFDPATIETIDGTVEKVVTSGGRGMRGVHVVLRSASGKLDVHLGPSWFIDNQSAKLQAGDTISVRGSRTVFAGDPALIAIDVKRGGETLRLRDEDGTPLWAAWRQSGAGPCGGAGNCAGGCPHMGR